MVSKTEISDWFEDLQDAICSRLVSIDGGAKFQEDYWERPGGGGGRSRILQRGELIEKGGVNFSNVSGVMPKKISRTLKIDEGKFFATGVSIVLHPFSPMVPIIHMNVRYFEMEDGNYWFGGGIDLTPHFIDIDLAKKFHVKLKTICDKFSSNYYPKFKSNADEYFYLKHRNETRGVGGIFFDRLTENIHHSKAAIWSFVQAVGECFMPAYTEQIQATRDLPYGENEKKWQKLRRGRYVEFNLLWDKGTKFGLDTNGRTESILMSMPPEADWDYQVEVEPKSSKAQTQTLLKKGINWINK